MIKKGYSLKRIKNNLYCYVWDERDCETTNEMRRLGNKNYSRSHEWRSLGNWVNPETHGKLRSHLYSEFGYGKEEMVEILVKVEEEILLFRGS